MSFFERKAKPIPKEPVPIFEVGKATPVDTDGRPIQVPMTATEVRLRRGESLAGTSSSGWTTTSTSRTGGGTEYTLRSTAISSSRLSTTGAGTTWTTTSTSPLTVSAVGTDGFIHPSREQFNVYTLLDGVTEGLYLRISENYYVLVSEVGQPNPSVTYHHNMTVTLVGNLLDWAMEAIDE